MNPESIPIVLSKAEVKRLLDASEDQKQKALISLAYSAGLRAGELTRLKVTDILSERRQIRIRNGKGNKDRYTLLADETLKTLREYYRAERPKIGFSLGSCLVSRCLSAQLNAASKG